MKTAGIFQQTASLTAKRPRFALLALSGLMLAAAMATAMAIAPTTETITRQTVVESLDLGDLSVLAQDDSQFFSEAVIQRGDTLQHLLNRLHVQDDAAAEFLRNAAEAAPLRTQFIAGRTVSAQVGNDGILHTLLFPLSDRESVLSVQRSQDQFRATVVAERPEFHVQTKTARIDHSLFGATDAAGIPDNIAIQLAELFGSEIDFHKDLRKGDRFTVSYEMGFLRGQPARSGKILAAEFINGDTTHRAVWFDRDNETGGEYLTPDGKPVRKAFLRSPLEFSRVSSGFSMRFHPILKTWRAHRGVDYAAPTGTPVRATANAVVDFAGTQSGYGTTVILKHDDRHSTLYAHLSRISNDVRRGKRVSQGQTIGYVGSTGWATGPHLHYEFRIRGEAVNPLSAKLPVLSASLNARERAQFNTVAATQLNLIDSLSHTEITYLE